ncbi:hypothetical protein [Cytobacillus sp. Bac17]|uniref:hypothetical protein n=1 Tax=Cytobacillus sp. Bac17 TaxID=2926008 RepID=UPI0021183D82|nr:hypothetical protein [Cytobacillus sp. Bac17]
MYTDEKLKINTEVALKQAINFTVWETIKLLPFLCGIVFFIYTSYSPIMFTLNEKKFLWTGLFIFIIYRTISNFNFLKKSLDHYTFVSELKKNPYPRSELITVINSYKTIADKLKLYIDILKSFSPVPIIVFILGLLLNNKNFSSLTAIQSFIKKLSPSNSLDSIYTIFTILVVVLYFWSLFATYFKYKAVQDRLLVVQNAYDEIKEKNEETKLYQELKSRK